MGTIIPLYKNKGSRMDPDNYRGITLLSCVGKLFTAAINERLKFLRFSKVRVTWAKNRQAFVPVFQPWTTSGHST